MTPSAPPRLRGRSRQTDQCVDQHGGVLTILGVTDPSPLSSRAPGASGPPPSPGPSLDSLPLVPCRRTGPRPPPPARPLAPAPSALGAAAAPLVVLEPNEQRYVWGVAVRTAPVGKVCHFRTPAISVSGIFSDETAETASVPSGLFRGRRWAGAVAALGWGMIPADLWPRGQVTHALPRGVPPSVAVAAL